MIMEMINVIPILINTLKILIPKQFKKVLLITMSLKAFHILLNSG